LSKKRFSGVLSPGQYFGGLELSHPSGEPIFASLKARLNSKLWVLSGPLYRKYTETYGIRSGDVNEEVLKRLIEGQSIFENISEEKKNLILSNAFKVPVNPGDVIIQQGLVGDFFYMVEDGEFEVYNTRPGKLPTLIDTLRAGSSFGAWSLLYDTPRAATVRSAAQGTLWAIDRRIFQQAIGPGPSYIQEAFDKYASVQINGQKFMTSADFFKSIRSSVCFYFKKYVMHF
jgi:hypothetical protein